jgi:hypothetical protein
MVFRRSLTEPIFIVPTDSTHIIMRWLSKSGMFASARIATLRCGSWASCRPSEPNHSSKCSAATDATASHRRRIEAPSWRRSIGASASASPRAKRNGPSEGAGAEAVPDRLAPAGERTRLFQESYSDNGSNQMACWPVLNLCPIPPSYSHGSEPEKAGDRGQACKVPRVSGRVP